MTNLEAWNISIAAFKVSIPSTESYEEWSSQEVITRAKGILEAYMTLLNSGFRWPWQVALGE